MNSLTSAEQWYGSLGEFPLWGTRVYLFRPYEGDTVKTIVYAWDYATNTQVWARQLPYMGVYTINVDPNNPQCLVYTADTGYFGYLDALTGYRGCQTASANGVALQGDAGFGSCGGNATVQRKNLTLLGVTGGGTAYNALLSVQTADGLPIAGWQSISSGWQRESSCLAPQQRH